jgi:hypothetical protein
MRLKCFAQDICKASMHWKVTKGGRWEEMRDWEKSSAPGKERHDVLAKVTARGGARTTRGDTPWARQAAGAARLPSNLSPNSFTCNHLICLWRIANCYSLGYFHLNCMLFVSFNTILFPNFFPCICQLTLIIPAHFAIANPPN